MEYTKTLITKNKKEQVEFRFTSGNGNTLLVIVSKDGWTYNKETPKSEDRWLNTKGFDVRMSMNGVFWLTFKEMNDIIKIIEDEIG